MNLRLKRLDLLLIHLLEQLGSQLNLPDFLEAEREQIESKLHEI